MRITPQQLSQYLKKGFAGCYLLFGTEAFLLEESAKLIRQHCQVDEVHHAIIAMESDLDALIAVLDQPSLFASSRLIDCKITKFTASMMQKMVQVLQANTVNTYFVLQMGLLTRPQQQAQWFAFIEQHGVIVPHFRQTPLQFAAWMETRAKHLGVVLTPSLRQDLLAKTQGNYLACAQEIEQLRLLGSSLSFINEQSQYEVNSLCEAVLAKNPERVIKILNCMKESGEAPQLVIWVLNQTLTHLLRCASGTSDITKMLQQAGIRFHLHPLYHQTLKSPLSYCCSSLLSCLSVADNQVKSGQVASAWQNVLRVSLQMAGINTFFSDPL